MPQVNNIASLREWFRECPFLSSDRRFRVDFISEDPIEYSLMESPTTIAYHENVLGEMVPDDIQSLNYIFMVRENYGSDVLQNIANSGFYQDVIGWIMQQNQKRNFPRIHEGDVRALYPTLTMAITEAGVESAIYQLQMRIMYKRH